MKVSLSWLRALLPGLPGDALSVAERLTSLGLEVEGAHAFGAGLETVLVASVVALEPHPSKSGLRLVTVDRGGGQTQRVVCGAPNVPPPGGLVVLAPLGTHLPAKGMTIEPRAIAGAEKTMLGFTTLTLAPIDRALIDVALLTPAEVEWIDTYHGRVAAAVGPLLDDAARMWLVGATLPLETIR